MRLFQMLPDAATLLTLEPEELAAALLEHLHSLPANERWSLSRYNFLYDPNSTFSEYPKANREPIALAVAEAWAWLEREGLLVRQVGSGSAERFVVSRRGAKMQTRADVDAYRHANLLPSGQLHPAIAQRVWATFLRGSYDTAVFESFREVEVAVRAAGRFSDRDIGVPLIRRAFDVTTGPLADSTRLEAERQAMSDLFAGAIGLYKNPHSHRNVALTDPREAVEAIVLASQLLRIVDARLEAIQSSNRPASA